MIKLLVLFISINISQHTHAGELDWEILKQWDSSEEALYSKFIEGLGKAIKKGICGTTNSCLKNPIANPLFYEENPRSLRNIFADCGDLPYVLRAYFAFMRHLPFVFPNGVTFYDARLEELKEDYYAAKREYDSYTFFNRPREVRRRYKLAKEKLDEYERVVKRDIRYSRSGNKITSLRRIRNNDNLNTILNQVVNSVSTAMYRVHGGLYDNGTVFRDTYPVKVTRKGIVPGTILYDSNGHVGVVVEVTPSGKIYLIDAHPDNSITYISYGAKFSRSSIFIGAGFVKFRPYTLSQSKYIPTANNNLPDFSLEQYYGTEDDRQGPWRDVAFYFDGFNLPFSQFVRARLSNNGQSIDPIEETTVLLNDLCRDFKDRVTAVKIAIDNRIDLKPHPQRFPDNIYGTTGEWETYSTPARDARLKASVREAYNSISAFVGEGNPYHFKFKYSGTDIRADLKEIYGNITNSCSLEIEKSDRDLVLMNLDKAMDRLFKFSFNPYMCVELRWALSTSELSSCSQASIKWDWYRASQYIRNQIERDYTQFMGYDLRGLINSNLGVRITPVFDFHALLD